MGTLTEIPRAVSRLNSHYFGRLASMDLLRIRHHLDSVLESRTRETGLFGEPKLIVPAPMDLVRVGSRALQSASVPEALGAVLSPSQVRTYLDCSAKWWFKHGLLLPEPKTSSLAFGLAIHTSLEINFCQKLGTKQDLEAAAVVMIFREAWMEQRGTAHFREDENPVELRRTGERLVAKYIAEAAPQIQPAAVEFEVEGKIGGVAVRGRVDLLDVEGTPVDLKTAAVGLPRFLPTMPSSWLPTGSLLPGHPAQHVWTRSSKRGFRNWCSRAIR
ncbi:MAG TPA: PD-(D/E)XK nuclease family protein [Bryobacteraceae bacterium]|nr:PD-(D/E)XK nuclease family protein [Bryobacteraceae bacterium]